MNPMKNNTPNISELSQESWEDTSVDFDSLSAFEKAIIDQSLREIEAGLGIPNAVVFKEAAQWLKEK